MYMPIGLVDHDHVQDSKSLYNYNNAVEANNYYN